MHFTCNLVCLSNRFLYADGIVLYLYSAGGYGASLNADEYQQQHQENEKSIVSKLDQIRRLRELATKTTSTLTQDKVQSGMKNKIENFVIQIICLENDVIKLREENLNLKKRAFLNGVKIKRGKA